MGFQQETSVFTRPSFCHMRTLVYGTLLASGRRTVIAALRAMGHSDERHFTTFHRVLNRAVWSPFHLSRILLGLLVMAFLTPDAPLILLIDGTLERR
jgi:DDE superfamily endonuclease